MTILNCPLCCKQNFNSVLALREHLLYYIYRPLTCELCNLSISSIYELTHHLEFHHVTAAIDTQINNTDNISHTISLEDFQGYGLRNNKRFSCNDEDLENENSCSTSNKLSPADAGNNFILQNSSPLYPVKHAETMTNNKSIFVMANQRDLESAGHTLFVTSPENYCNEKVGNNSNPNALQLYANSPNISKNFNIDASVEKFYRNAQKPVYKQVTNYHNCTQEERSMVQNNHCKNGQYHFETENFMTPSEKSPFIHSEESISQSDSYDMQPCSHTTQDLSETSDYEDHTDFTESSFSLSTSPSVASKQGMLQELISCPTCNTKLVPELYDWHISFDCRSDIEVNGKAAININKTIESENESKNNSFKVKKSEMTINSKTVAPACFAKKEWLKTHQDKLKISQNENNPSLKKFDTNILNHQNEFLTVDRLQQKPLNTLNSTGHEAYSQENMKNDIVTLRVNEKAGIFLPTEKKPMSMKQKQIPLHWKERDNKIKPMIDFSDNRIDSEVSNKTANSIESFQPRLSNVILYSFSTDNSEIEKCKFGLSAQSSKSARSLDVELGVRVANTEKNVNRKKSVYLSSTSKVVEDSELLHRNVCSEYDSSIEPSGIELNSISKLNAAHLNCKNIDSKDVSDFNDTFVDNKLIASSKIIDGSDANKANPCRNENIPTVTDSATEENMLTEITNEKKVVLHSFSESRRFPNQIYSKSRITNRIRKLSGSFRATQRFHFKSILQRRKSNFLSYKHKKFDLDKGRNLAAEPIEIEYYNDQETCNQNFQSLLLQKLNRENVSKQKMNLPVIASVKMPIFNNKKNVNGNKINKKDSNKLRSLSRLLKTKTNILKPRKPQTSKQSSGILKNKSCAALNSDFKTQQKVNKESETESKPKVYNCRVCNKNFKTYSLVFRHEKEVHQSSAIFCNLCGKHFKSKRILSRHKNIHTANKKYCSQCEYFSYSSSSLSAHVANKHNKSDKKLFCDICDESFSTKHNLSRHFERKHASNNFLCRFCDKKFKCKDDLTAHVNCHLNNKTCSICSKIFSTASSLKRHKKRHEETENKNKFSCHQCKKSFTRKDSLNNHVKLIHDKNCDIKCIHCDAFFVRKSHLKKHLKTHERKKVRKRISKVESKPVKS